MFSYAIAWATRAVMPPCNRTVTPWQLRRWGLLARAAVPDIKPCCPDLPESQSSARGAIRQPAKQPTVAFPGRLPLCVQSAPMPHLLGSASSECTH